MCLEYASPLQELELGKIAEADQWDDAWRAHTLFEEHSFTERLSWNQTFLKSGIWQC